jgi:hypothetical protein
MSPASLGRRRFTQRIGGESSADKFASFAEKELEERKSILQGKHTPGSAELMVRREINFHWAFLAGTAIVWASRWSTVRCARG